MPCLFISIRLSLATIWYTRLRRIHKSYSLSSLFCAFIFLALANELPLHSKQAIKCLAERGNYFENKQFYWIQNQITTIVGLQKSHRIWEGTESFLRSELLSIGMRRIAGVFQTDGRHPDSALQSVHEGCCRSLHCQQSAFSRLSVAEQYFESIQPRNTIIDGNGSKWR